MNATTQWNLDTTRILTRKEVERVILDLKRRAPRSINSRMNLAIFRLATCCGLRASEIAGLRLANVHTGIAKPHVYVPKTVGKGGKARRVPLWWDSGTLADIEAWKAERESAGADNGDPFVCTLSRAAFGHRIHRNGIRRRFIAACRTLGAARQVTVHDGRHSFVSHALRGGRTLAEVKQAAGHANIATTSVYLHVAVEDEGAVGNLFGVKTPATS